MPAIKPISRRELVKNLRRLGFDGPIPRGKHELMAKEDASVIIPNPHRGGISVGLLRRLLKQAGITRQEWENL